jgi:uncharacterized protein DUF5335
MRTRLIPRAEWSTFFKAFTREHFGWPATVWILGPRIGAQVEARELPLEGIVADPLAISIHLGGMPGKDVEHPVAGPVSVWLETSEEDGLGALGINAADGTTTLVEFRSPVPAVCAHPVRPDQTIEARPSRQ